MKLTCNFWVLGKILVPLDSTGTTTTECPHSCWWVKASQTTDSSVVIQEYDHDSAAFWERRNFPCVSILQLEYGHFALIVLPWNFLVHGNKFGGMPFLMPPMTNTTVGDSGTRSNTRSLRENPAP